MEGNFSIVRQQVEKKRFKEEKVRFDTGESGIVELKTGRITGELLVIIVVLNFGKELKFEMKILDGLVDLFNGILRRTTYIPLRIMPWDSNGEEYRQEVTIPYYLDDIIEIKIEGVKHIPGEIIFRYV